jgi:hypothetical protein
MSAAGAACTGPTTTVIPTTTAHSATAMRRNTILIIERDAIKPGIRHITFRLALGATTDR